MRWSVVRHFNKGNAVGGHVLVAGKLAVASPIPCAAVELHVGSEEVWLTRDEACEAGFALINAAQDA